MNEATCAAPLDRLTANQPARERKCRTGKHYAQHANAPCYTCFVEEAQAIQAERDRRIAAGGVLVDYVAELRNFGSREEDVEVLGTAVVQGDDIFFVSPTQPELAGRYGAERLYIFEEEADAAYQQALRRERERAENAAALAGIAAGVTS